MVVLNQIPGKTPLYKEISTLLTSGEFEEFSILMSYMTWDGLSLFSEELEAFYDNGGKLKFIVGIGEKGAEIEALRYLNQRMPKGNYKVFSARNTAYIFHPKLYIFRSKDRTVCLIGSNNLTVGGLYRNSELSVKIDDSDNTAELLKVWDVYNKPKKPFSSQNLIKVGSKFFSRYDKILINNPAQVPTPEKKKKTAVEIFTEKFGKITIHNPKTKSFPIEIDTSKKRKNTSKAKTKGSILLLEILNETGAGGVQVQIPTQVCNEYFKATGTINKTIQLVDVNGVRKPGVVCHFDNHTHRISLSDVAGHKRPLLVSFEKNGRNSYDYRLITKRAEYKQLIKKCNQQTRSGSKRWAIIDTLDK